MSSVLPLLFIILISFLVVRVGTNALVLTGMSYQSARFQAISAFFGVGFTTSEAEMVMENEVRRRVVRYLIVLGNIGLTSALATLIVTFTQHESGDGLSDYVFLGAAVLTVLALGLFFNISFFTKPLDKFLKQMLESAGVVRALDYDLLLKLEDGYCVSEVKIEEGHPWAGKELQESRPSDANVVILNIHHKDGRFTGAPNKDDRVEVGDELMVYGASEAVDKAAHMHIENWQGEGEHG